MMIEPVKIAVVGLGYVGLPLARLFSTRHEVIGYDTNRKRIKAIMAGNDATNEVSHEQLAEAIDQGFRCTASLEDIRGCEYFIITVPTPVDVHHTPDLRPLLAASAAVGKVISPGNVVIYESTVYPGATEEECVPVIERVSGLRYNVDFFAGYSPERINPGDREHTVEKIRKVTAGSTPEVAERIDALYRSVLVNGTHKASSIRVAEASKIIENTQRDVNIAFMNEIAQIFNAMGIDTHEVIEASSTKWNFVRMFPGLVGGHCIGVDPYYLIQKSEAYGILPRMMFDARRLNDSMGGYVAGEVIRMMNRLGIVVRNARILLLGFTFKENCPDIRNTKVVDIYNTLKEYTSNISVFDPYADPLDVHAAYGITLEARPLEAMHGQFDVVVLCVPHDAFYPLNPRLLIHRGGGVYDVKGALPRELVDGRL